MKKNLGSFKRCIERVGEKTLAITFPSLLLAQYPKSLVIELTNICNLRCPLCPSSVSYRQKGVMPFSNFVHIAETLPKSISSLELYLSGEPFLNKDLFRIIRYVYEKAFIAL